MVLSYSLQRILGCSHDRLPIQIGAAPSTSIFHVLCFAEVLWHELKEDMLRATEILQDVEFTVDWDAAAIVAVMERLGIEEIYSNDHPLR